MKHCTKCLVEKPLDDFHKGNSSYGRASWCKVCAANYARKRNESFSEGDLELKRSRGREYARNHKEQVSLNGKVFRASRYGLTVEAYELILSQGCWICGSSENLHLDHDHSCCPNSKTSCGSCIRGPLCVRHNQGLGSFKDNIEHLKKAICYLETFR